LKSGKVQKRNILLYTLSPTNLLSVFDRNFFNSISRVERLVTASFLERLKRLDYHKRNDYLINGI